MKSNFIPSSVTEKGGIKKATESIRKTKPKEPSQQILLKLIEGEGHEKTGYFERALRSYLQAQELAKKTEITDFDDRINFQLGRIYISLGYINRGLKQLKKLVLTSKKTLDYELLIRTFNAMGYGYRIIGNKKLANYYINKAFTISNKNSKLSQKSKLAVLHNRAGLLRESAKYKAALKIYLLLIKKADKRDSFFMARLLNNAGFIYRKEKQYKKARAYYLKAYELEQLIGARHLQARTLNNLGGISRMEGDLTTALEHFTKSAQIRKQLHDQLGLSSSLLNKGVVLKELGESKRGQKYLLQSYAIRKLSGSKPLLKEVMLELKNL